MEIAELVHDEIYGHGFERWLQSIREASPNGTLTHAELESAMMDFDYMFRNGRARRTTKSSQAARAQSKNKPIPESGSTN